MHTLIKTYALYLAWSLLGWLKRKAAGPTWKPVDQETEKAVGRYLVEALKNGNHGVQKMDWGSPQPEKSIENT